MGVRGRLALSVERALQLLIVREDPAKDAEELLVGRIEVAYSRSSNESQDNPLGLLHLQCGVSSPERKEQPSARVRGREPAFRFCGLVKSREILTNGGGARVRVSGCASDTLCLA